MSDLYPTKTRLRLLRAVQSGDVLDGSVLIDDDALGNAWLCEPGEERRKVTARVIELEEAGWIVLDEPYVHWTLTAEGARVLAAAENESRKP